ncbi:MAG TPA: FAD-binding oxidoreductase [candidate division Zixibacteria bacterium]|nr:FAD-binding oxidoreductase [candidate division Zixibacteria bacterium]MDD4918344.1 FAD-binding oxidoreductase [candidate division Zixibacteria bacterium]MDM7973771.1 FAD-binding oxidoreductase [candidate division Zixibacteria bacterium]HOZ07658.1 FAD-binding oxidoreductase [candidate division Zixibacteria bacterium]HPM38321.1 FAD-binding oxidoreductase [candidate division Zixibacteria bacterium]
MANLDAFVRVIKGEFPDDRLTWQKGIATFHPESAAEAAGLFGLANEHRQPLFITGFGNNIEPAGEAFAGLVAVRTDRLNRFLDVSKEDFAVEVGAGYPLRELNDRLRAEELYLPHAALPYVGSAGGAVAVGLAGELHGAEVPIKKYFITAEIVTGEGEIIQPGSRCFKSVSGYDIVRIFAGAWGLLGLIVRATFRVMPIAGAGDFATMRQRAITRSPLAAALDRDNDAADAVYSRKIKDKFDPRGVLPAVERAGSL